MESGESVGLVSFFKSSARADVGGFGSVPHTTGQIAARRALGLTESQTKARPGGHEGRKEYEMYGTIIIKTAEAQARFKTSEHDRIYDFLTDHGYSHDIAANVEGWADLASIGEEYELDGAEIIIVD